MIDLKAENPHSLLQRHFQQICGFNGVQKLANVLQTELAT